MSKMAQKKFAVWFLPILVSIFVSGCGTEGDPILGSGSSETNTTIESVVPTVFAVTPENNESNVSVNIKHIIAEFSIPMDQITLNTANFKLSKTDTPDVNVTVTSVAYASRVADFTLTSDSNLSADTNYTATITTDVKSEDNISLDGNYSWIFTTGLIPDETLPEVNATKPRDGELNVSVDKTITATFSEAIKSTSIKAVGTFRVYETIIQTNEVTDKNLSYALLSKTASFNPDSNLTADMNYTAIITTVVEDLAGNQMANDYNWTFRTAAAPIIVPELVNFGLAAPFGVASAAGVNNIDVLTDKTRIDGDVVLNPTPTCNSVQTTSGVDGTFGLCGGMAPELSFGHEVITQIYPDTTTADAVRADLHQAYLDITPANMPSGTTLTSANTYGATGATMVPGQNHFTAGVYESAASINIANDLTLDAEGNENATFVFQAGSTLITAPNTRILLVGGAKASNVYWQVGSSATLGDHTVWNGNILAAVSITMENGTDSCGRLFAGATTDSGAFTFQSNLVAVPGNSAVLAGCE